MKKKRLKKMTTGMKWKLNRPPKTRKRTRHILHLLNVKKNKSTKSKSLNKATIHNRTRRHNSRCRCQWACHCRVVWPCLCLQTLQECQSLIQQGKTSSHLAFHHSSACQCQLVKRVSSSKCRCLGCKCLFILASSSQCNKLLCQTSSCKDNHHSINSSSSL